MLYLFNKQIIQNTNSQTFKLTKGRSAQPLIYLVVLILMFSICSSSCRSFSLKLSNSFSLLNLICTASTFESSLIVHRRCFISLTSTSHIFFSQIETGYEPIIISLSSVNSIFPDRHLNNHSRSQRQCRKMQ